METNRRQFLGVAAGTLTAAQLPHLHAQETEAKQVPVKKKPVKPVSTDPVALVPLTETIRCSRIGFGTGMRGGRRESNLTRSGRENAVELLRFAYDHGVRLFDLADLYGTHAFTTEALAGKPRDSYTIISKIWVRPGGIPEPERPDADEVVERFLKECKTDYIDLIQLHCMDNDRWPVEWEKQMTILEKLKKDGKIRAHGVSTHSNRATEAAAATGWADAVHIRINSEGERMDGKAGEEATVTNTVKSAERLQAAGIGVIAMKVVGEGVFRDKPELRKKSTTFVTNLPCVDAMVVGFEAKEQITEFITNVEAALKEAAAKA